MAIYERQWTDHEFAAYVKDRGLIYRDGGNPEIGLWRDEAGISRAVVIYNNQKCTRRIFVYEEGK